MSPLLEKRRQPKWWCSFWFPLTTKKGVLPSKPATRPAPFPPPGPRQRLRLPRLHQAAGRQLPPALQRGAWPRTRRFAHAGMALGMAGLFWARTMLMFFVELGLFWGATRPPPSFVELESTPNCVSIGGSRMNLWQFPAGRLVSYQKQGSNGLRAFQGEQTFL